MKGIDVSNQIQTSRIPIVVTQYPIMGSLHAATQEPIVRKKGIVVAPYGPTIEE